MALYESLYLNYMDGRKVAVPTPWYFADATTSNAANVSHISLPVPDGFYFDVQSLTLRTYSTAMNVNYMELILHIRETTKSIYLRSKTRDALAGAIMGVESPSPILLPEGATVEGLVNWTGAHASNTVGVYAFGYLIPPLDL